MRTALALLFLLVTATALPAGSRPTSPTPPETIYTNASIWTGVPGAPRAEALAVRDGKIAAVGSAAAVAKLAGPSTRTVDLGGAFVVPGLIDTHTHFLVGGFQLASLDLRGAASREDFVHRLGEFAKRLPKGKWITGGDWDHEAWGGELPRRDWIDAVTPDNPVFVNRLDGHMALANSRALELAGVTKATRDPEGGLIVRDPSDSGGGEPTGILKDEAMALVARVQPAPTDAERDEALDRAMTHAVAHGVTQIHSMGTWDDLATFRRARRARGVAAPGGLRLRIYAFVPLDTWPRLAELVNKEGRGDDWLRWGGLKGFVDGSLGSTTAWFHQPYTDAPTMSGLVVTDSARLATDIRKADAARLQVAVHAIGDRANDWLLDTFAQAAAANGARDRRFRIEHAQHLTRAAIPRFAALGVIPSMQPYHAIDDGRWAEKRIGPERIRTTYAFRSLLDQGAQLAFGSDWTVAPLSPLDGIYAAVTRRTLDGKNPGGWVPEQKITVEEALHAYTAGGARAGFQEDRLGTLETGRLADFVALSQDLFRIDPNDIRDVRVLRTVIGGREVYSARGARLKP
jgi:predicted amidohydrolase YtcJ